VFTDESFNFKVQCMLGELRTGCGDAGEIMSTTTSIADGDGDSWVTGWRALAERVDGAHDPDAVLGPVFATHRRCFHHCG